MLLAPRCNRDRNAARTDPNQLMEAPPRRILQVWRDDDGARFLDGPSVVAFASHFDR